MENSMLLPPGDFMNYSLSMTSVDGSIFASIVQFLFDRVNSFL